jgi:predicted metal-dependent enzyme (double-stranded beta helix superfamily)
MAETLAARRSAAVRSAITDIRTLELAGPLDRDRLDGIRARLVQLAAQRELFPAADFPAPPPGERPGSCLYRLSQDDDDRFALYVNACRDETDTPPHNHTTWAIVVGFDGEELNRFYRRTSDGGVEEIGQDVVAEGRGVTMLPDDLHSIHIRGGALNFHLYGLALERLDRREYFRADDRTWHTFPAHRDIREARGETAAGTAAGVAGTAGSGR